MTHPKNLVKSGNRIKPDENPDDPLDALRERAEDEETVELFCPTCHEPKKGTVMFNYGDLAWECPDCGLNNLEWV